MLNKEIKPFCRTDSVSNMIVKNSNQIVLGGKKLVRKNSFFEDLSELMENTKFQNFWVNICIQWVILDDYNIYQII